MFVSLLCHKFVRMPLEQRSVSSDLRLKFNPRICMLSSL